MGLRLSVRAKLTAWHVAVLATILLGYSVSVYAFLNDTLHSSLDQLLREDIEAAEEDIPALLADETGRFVSQDKERWLFEIWNERNELERQWPRSPTALLPSPSAACLSNKTTSHSTATADGLSVRYACRTVSELGKRFTLRAVRSSERAMAELRRLLLAMMIGLPAAIAAAALGGYALARRALSPVQRMTEQARQISAQHLSERFSIPNPDDELGQLAKTFNETFSRLERSFDQMRRFTADASHELRTPLTAIRTVGEVALRETRDTADYREVIASILEEADSLRQLVDNLLTLSRADAGQLAVTRQPMELSVLAKDVIDHLHVLAEEKRQSLILETEGHASTHGDPQILRRALINIVDNAIKYAPIASMIRVRVGSDVSSAWIEVIDEGPGIPAEHRDQIFERFYRVDPSRSRQQAGTGLGLAIARWAVEAHGGAISVESDAGRGSAFRISIPSTPAP